jgi:hypothetical protein
VYEASEASRPLDAQLLSNSRASVQSRSNATVHTSSPLNTGHGTHFEGTSPALDPENTSFSIETGIAASSLSSSEHLSSNNKTYQNLMNPSTNPRFASSLRTGITISSSTNQPTATNPMFQERHHPVDHPYTSRSSPSAEISDAMPFVEHAPSKGPEPMRAREGGGGHFGGSRRSTEGLCACLGETGGGGCF